MPKSPRSKTMYYSSAYPSASTGVERMSIGMQKAALASAKRRLRAAHAKELARMEGDLKRALHKATSKQFHKQVSARLERIKSRVKKR